MILEFRTSSLHAVMQTLNYLADKFNLAVVVTNQVTTVPKEGNSPEQMKTKIHWGPEYGTY